MEFDIPTLVKYLRESVLVEEPTLNGDSAWLGMTDDDLAVVLEVAKHRDFPKQILASLSAGVVYPLMLVAKKELYYRLAVKSAPNYDLKGENAGEIKRSQRFEHFMSLIKQIDKELEEYMKDGYFGEDGIGDLDDEGYASRNRIYTKELLSTKHYYSRRNYDLYKNPVVNVSVDNITKNGALISWTLSGYRAPLNCKVYISKEPSIYDEYKHTTDPKADVAFSTIDMRKTHCEIENLDQGTQYCILVDLVEANGIHGRKQILIETPAE